MLRVSYYLFALISYLAMAACDSEAPIPKKPESVPDTAYWAWGPKHVGGAGWGDWVNCEVTSSITMTCDRYSKDGSYFVRSFLRVCLGVRLPNADLSRYNPYVPRVGMAGDDVTYFEDFALFSERPTEFHPLDDSITKEVIDSNINLAKKGFEEFGVNSDCTPHFESNASL